MTVYHSHPKFSHRPHNFRRVLDHPLWDGCVFAGLGALSGSERYQDSSLYGNPGTLENISVDNWSSGLGRSGLYVPRSEVTAERVRLSNPAILQGAGAATVSAWIKPDFLVTDGGDRYVFDATYNTSHNQLGVRLMFISTIDGFRWRVLGSSAVNCDTPKLSWNPGEWHHVAGTWDGTTSRIYWDGVQLNSMSVSGPLSSTAATIAFVGARTDSSPNNGPAESTLADVLVHRAALPATEIVRSADPTNVMLDGAIEPIPTNTYFLPKPSIPPVDKAFIPYHHQPKHSHRPNNFRRVLDHPLWDGCIFAGLGQLAGGEQYWDSSVRNRQVSIAGFDASNISNGIGRHTVSLTSADTSNYVDLGSDFTQTEFAGTNPFTMAIWVKQSPGGSGNQRAISRWEPSVSHYLMGDIGGTMSFYFGGTSTATFSGWSSGDGNWHHLCGVRTSSNIYLYVDDVQRGSDTSTSFLVASCPTYLGHYGFGSQDWNGELADAVFYTRVLSLAEISRLADPTNFMLDGAIEPIPTATYFLPVGTTPPPTGGKTRILRSRIIRGVM